MRETYRATVTLADDTKDIPLVQVDGLSQPAWAENVLPYGIANNPPVGSPAVVLPIGGEQENLSAFITGPDVRVPGLAEGEMAIGNFMNGTFLKFTASGNVEFYSLNALVMRMNSTLTQLLLGNMQFDHNLAVTGTTALTGAVTTAASVTAASVIASSILATAGGVNLTSHRHVEHDGFNTGVPVA